MSLSPRDFRAGRILMLGFLVILVSRDLVNLYYRPSEPPRLVLSLLVAGVVCATYGWFWLRVAGTGDSGRATAALAVLTAGVVAYTVIDPSRSCPFYSPSTTARWWREPHIPGGSGALSLAVLIGLNAATSGHSPTTPSPPCWPRHLDWATRTAMRS